MRAALLRNVGDTNLEVVDSLAIGDVGPTEVKVRIHATGVCHSDLHGMEGTLPAMPNSVMGHEGAGDVLEVGAQVSGIAVGDHVVIAWSPPCGRCIACVDQKSPHLCSEIQFAASLVPHYKEGDVDVYSFISAGTFAEEVIVTQEACIKIDDDVPWDVASLIGCGVTTGVMAAVNTAKVQPGSTCVVIGCGGVGISVIQGCRLAGAAVIVAVDRNPDKLEMAKQFGATHACGPDDVADLKAQLTGAAHGFDYAFEAIGLSATVRAAYDAARRGGTVCIVGAGKSTDFVSFNLLELFFEEKTIKGSYYGSADVRTDFNKILRLWRAGKIDLEAMITKRIKLDDINDAIESLRKAEVIRTVVEL